MSTAVFAEMKAEIGGLLWENDEFKRELTTKEAEIERLRTRLDAAVELSRLDVAPTYDDTHELFTAQYGEHVAEGDSAQSAIDNLDKLRGGNDG